MSRLAEIKQKLALLKERDGDLRIAGASHHRYVMSAPLTERQLRQFEHEYGVVLPEDYCAFLTEVGNGGVGPICGMIAQERALLAEQDPQLLAKPFPLVSTLDFWALLKERTGVDPFERAGGLNYKRLDENEESRRAYHSLADHLHGSYFSQGALAICHYGCGMMFCLVVTGDERGNVWLDDRANGNGLFPVLHRRDKRHLDFLSWYEAWLDHSLWVLDGPASDQGEISFLPWSIDALSGGRYWPWGE